MGRNTNQIATESDVDHFGETGGFYPIPIGGDPLATKSYAESAGLQVSGSYVSNQCVKYSDLSKPADPYEDKTVIVSGTPVYNCLIARTDKPKVTESIGGGGISIQPSVETIKVTALQSGNYFVANVKNSTVGWQKIFASSTQFANYWAAFQALSYDEILTSSDRQVKIEIIKKTMYFGSDIPKTVGTFTLISFTSIDKVCDVGEWPW